MKNFLNLMRIIKDYMVKYNSLMIFLTLKTNRILKNINY